MAARGRVDPEVEVRVRLRAGALCEYCHANERWQYVRFTVDHVMPLSTGGADGEENLALACFHCNRHKSDRSTAPDPSTGKEVALFHPRRDVWAEHFIWSKDRLRVVGVSTTGSATIAALQMNRDRVVQIRAADLAVGRHPPDGDPIAIG